MCDYIKNRGTEGEKESATEAARTQMRYRKQALVYLTCSDNVRPKPLAS